MKRGIFLLVLGLFVGASVALAGSADIYSFSSEQASQRFVNLTKELRCLVCQNQSLADSDATLARDLRQKVYLMIQENKSDAEIREFLVSRYGQFILFSPPLMTSTLLLWGFPGLVLAGIIGGLLYFRRR